MKRTIKIAGIIAAMMMTLSLSTTAFAAEGDAADDQHRVVRVDIPNSDGTFTTLEGDEAQQWYDRVMEQSKQIAAEEQALNKQNIVERDFRGPFHYKYRYIESKHTRDIERGDLEKIVSNKLRNNSSVEQEYKLDLSVSQSWSISPSLSAEFKNAVKAGVSGSWGNSYSKSESFTTKIAPGKTLWISFIPIMDKSEGTVEKYYIPRGGINKNPIVVEKHKVVSYNPQYTTCKMGPFTFKSVYGTYVWNEK